MGWAELHGYAARTLARANLADVEVRRAISTLYYGLFHHLSSSGSLAFQAGGPALEAQAARAYAHGAMRKVCERYNRLPVLPFGPALAGLNHPTPDRRLGTIAQTFLSLQEARHSADYDLQATFTRQDAGALTERAQTAHDDLDAIQHQPATTIFLTALLLDDRWTRRA